MITRVFGLDGKNYPSRPLSRGDRLRLIGRVHTLAHEGLSVRQIVVRLGEEGVRRSVGSVSEYLTTYRCSDCSGGAFCPPEQNAPPENLGDG